MSKVVCKNVSSVAKYYVYIWKICRRMIKFGSLVGHKTWCNPYNQHFNLQSALNVEMTLMELLLG